MKVAVAVIATATVVMVAVFFALVATIHALASHFFSPFSYVYLPTIIRHTSSYCIHLILFALLMFFLCLLTVLNLEENDIISSRTAIAKLGGGHCSAVRSWADFFSPVAAVLLLIAGRPLV